MKELIKENLKTRFQDLKNKEITFAEFSENSDEWLESLKLICSKEMNVGPGEFKDNRFLGLFYKNSVFSDRFGEEEVLPEIQPEASVGTESPPVFKKIMSIAETLDHLQLKNPKASANWKAAVRKVGQFMKTAYQFQMPKPSNASNLTPVLYMNKGSFGRLDL